MQAEMEEAGGKTPGGLEASRDRLRQLYFRRLHGQGDSVTDRELVGLVLDHARRVIAHPSRPTQAWLEPFPRYPAGDLALDETLEESPLIDVPEDFLVERREEKPFTCVAMLDTSSSMSGEKHLLASVAVAVLLLDVPPRDTALSVFSSRAQSIKKLSVDEAPAQTVLRFLRTQPKGFTNIHAGLTEGLAQYRSGGGRRRRVGLIATDGRTTEGPDPGEAAKQYDFLVVLHLHGPGSHLEASQELAQKGHGTCLEVENFTELPRRLYDALRLLARL